MRYAVGYFDHDERERSFVDTLECFQGHLAEVYFPWPGMGTCRTAPQGPYAFERMTEALSVAKEMGISLDLLINANCYGGRAISKALEKTIVQSVEDVYRRAGGLDVVTTTSLAAAHVVKKHFQSLRVRASINMQLRHERAFEPLLELFDEFYLPREFNHDFEAIDRIKGFLGEKKLFALANSGCMPWCPGQIFHDNLVAHEEEVSQTRNMEGFVPYVCWEYYRKQPHMLMQGTWIRPEDMARYESRFSMMKLATRINERPFRVIKAYVEGCFRGNLLNLMEPDHSAVLNGAVLDNAAFPKDWEDDRQDSHQWYRELYKQVLLRNELPAHIRHDS